MDGQHKIADDLPWDAQLARKLMSNGVGHFDIEQTMVLHGQLRTYEAIDCCLELYN